MAYKIAARQDINFSSSSWDTEETGNLAVNDVTIGESYPPLSPTVGWSNQFTILNNHMIYGVLFFGRKVTNEGYVYFEISDNGGVSSRDQIYVPVSNLPSTNSWIVAIFNNITGDGGNDYCVGIRVTSANSCIFTRGNNTYDWRRIPIWINNSAVANGDIMIVAAPYLINNSYTTRRVVVDNTNSGLVLNRIDIGCGGIVSFSGTGPASYYLSTSGDISVYEGGKLAIAQGSLGSDETSPLPSNVTATLQSTGTDRYLYCWGTLEGKGENIVTTAKLQNDRSAGDTTSTTDVATNWRSGDRVIFLTTGSGSSNETLTANASGTTLTHTALDYAFKGEISYPRWYCKIMNATRNAVISGSGLKGYCYTGSTLSLSYVHCTGVRGFVVSGGSGTSVSANNNVFYNCNYANEQCFDFTSTANVSADLRYNCFYNVYRAYRIGTTLGSYDCRYGVGSSYNDWLTLTDAPQSVLVDNSIIGSINNFLVFSIGNYYDKVFEVNNCRCMGAYRFVAFRDYCVGYNIVKANNCDFSGTYYAIGTTTARVKKFIVEDSHLNVNSTFLTMQGSLAAIFDGCDINRDNLYASCNAALISGDSNIKNESSGYIAFINCNIGGLPTIQYLLSCNASQHYAAQRVYLYGCSLSVSTLSNLTQDYRDFSLRIHPYLTNNNYLTLSKKSSSLSIGGQITSNNSVYRTASPSEAVGNFYTGYSSESSRKRIILQPGQQATVSVYVYIPATSHSSTAVSLICNRNPVAGVDTEQTIDTHSGARDVWEELSGVLPAVSEPSFLEVYVRSDCSSGSNAIYVDDWSVTIS